MHFTVTMSSSLSARFSLKIRALTLPKMIRKRAEILLILKNIKADIIKRKPGTKRRAHCNCEMH